MIELRKEMILILALTVAPLLIFVWKPIHIDDSSFVEMAQNSLQYTFNPYYGNVALLDQDYLLFRRLGKDPNGFEAISYPPFIPYFISIVLRIVGRVAEVPSHLAFIVFPVMLGFSALFIARRFSATPRASVLLLITCPIFMVNAQNLMTDVPMLAFSLCGLALLIFSFERNDVRLALLAGVSAALASSCQYSGLITPLLFIVYGMFAKKEFRLTLIAIAAFLGVFGLWLAQNLIIYGTPHIIASYKFSKHFAPNVDVTKHFSHKVISDFAALGGCGFFLALLLAYFGKNRLKITAGVSLGVVALLAIFLIPGPADSSQDFLPGYTTGTIITLLALVFAGCLFLVETFYVAISVYQDTEMQQSSRRNLLFLAAWFVVSLFSAIFLHPFGTSRFMLPVLFPMILILTSVYGERTKRELSFSRIAIVITFVLGLVLSWADCEFALNYKIFAKDFRENYPKEKIWFTGEWGFRHYMKEQGGEYLLSTDTSPKIGDLIVRPRIAGLHKMAPSINNRCAIFDPYEVETPNPIRVLNYSATAGFYSHGFGLFPFSLADVPLEHFDVCRIIVVD